MAHDIQKQGSPAKQEELPLPHLIGRQKCDGQNSNSVSSGTSDKPDSEEKPKSLQCEKSDTDEQTNPHNDDESQLTELSKDSV